MQMNESILKKRVTRYVYASHDTVTLSRNRSGISVDNKLIPSMLDHRNTTCPVLTINPLLLLWGIWPHDYDYKKYFER